MKIGLNLVGISHDDGGRHTGWNKSNIKDSIINSLNNENEVNVYITTYFNDENTKELINHYNPKNVNILEYDGSDQRLTYIESLKSLLNEDIDVVISTRFDMFFHKDIQSITTIDYSKFNFLHPEKGWWNSRKFVDDNLFIFPKKYLTVFIESLEELFLKPPRLCQDLHPIYTFVKPKIGEENINFITKNETKSGINHIYTFIRLL